MTDVQSTVRLDRVPALPRAPLRLLVEQLWTALGHNLRSVTVVGSSLTEDFHPRASDINTVAVVEEHTMTTLKAVAALVRPLSRQKLSPPLLMTPAYIERSRDVFGIEFLDFQLTHETIFGDDPFALLRVQRAGVRLQCERELKAMLVRLRQGYLAATGHRRLVRDILIATAKGLAPVARALLWLKGIERPPLMEAALRTAAGEFEVDLDAAIAAERWRYERRRLSGGEVEQAFVSLAEAVDALATRVDELEP
jgi:hypothetical protein